MREEERVRRRWRKIERKEGTQRDEDRYGGGRDGFISGCRYWEYKTQQRKKEKLPRREEELEDTTDAGKERTKRDEEEERRRDTKRERGRDTTRRG